MAVVQEVERKDAILLAMSDDYMRQILCSIMSEAKSIERISKENGIPVSTCYRRIRELLSFRLARIERTIITPEGKKYETFRSTIADAKISFSVEDLTVEVTPLKINPEDRLHNMWSAAKRIDEKSLQQQSLPILEIRTQ
jgi:hypothetical protein